MIKYMIYIKALAACLVVVLLCGCDPNYKLYIRNKSADTIQISIGKNLLKFQRNSRDSSKIKSREIQANDCYKGVGYKIYPNEDFFIYVGMLSILPSPNTFIDSISIKKRDSCITVKSIDAIKKNVIWVRPGFHFYYVIN